MKTILKKVVMPESVTADINDPHAKNLCRGAPVPVIQREMPQAMIELKTYEGLEFKCVMEDSEANDLVLAMQSGKSIIITIET